MELLSLAPWQMNIHPLHPEGLTPGTRLTQIPLWQGAIALTIFLTLGIVAGYWIRRRRGESPLASQGDCPSPSQGCQDEGHQVQVNSHNSEEGLRQRAVEIENRERISPQDYAVMIASLEKLLEARDPYTRGHSERVRYYCRQIASRLALSPEEMTILDQAAQLHDLGKIGIPDYILHKPGPLSPPEWAQVKLHPQKTVEFLRMFPFLQQALPLIRGHHERWNGEGYPDGLSGEDIPLGARILSVADAYDAMTSERPYRFRLSHQEAVEQLKKAAGTQWDPRVVEVLIRVLNEGQPPEYHR